MLRRILALAPLLGLLIIPTKVLGQTQQPWLADRRYGEGPGILSGNLEIHPGVALEAGYDSNFFQAAGDDPSPLLSEPITPVVRIRVTPSLSLRTLGPERRSFDNPDAAPPKANFQLGAALRVDKLSALEGPDTGPANETHVEGDLGAQVEIGPREPFGAALGASYSRFVNPSNDPDTQSTGLNRNRYGGNLDLIWRPGGGTLSWSAGYHGNVLQFDNPEHRLDRAEHGFRTRGRYRFLPRTALLYEGEIGLVTQLHQDSRQGNAAPISSQLGINGLVTTRISALLLGGVKAMFFEPTDAGSLDDFDGFIGRGELTWFFGPAAEGSEGPEDRGVSHLRFGVQRDVLPGGVGNFYQLNRGFLELGMMAGGVVVVTARTGFSIVVHATPRDDNGQPLSSGGEVTEQRPEAGLYAEYRVLPSVAVLGNIEFTASQPNNYIVVDSATFLQDNLKFSRFSALAGVRWFL